MIIRLLIFGLLIVLCLGCAGSNNSTIANSAFNTEKVDRKYIPKDLDDCFVQLEKLLKSEDIEKMRSGPEENMILYHLDLGMWLRNNWGLWTGSRLSEYFNAMGIKHPDHMSGLILDAFWQYLNDRPISLDEMIEKYRD